MAYRQSTLVQAIQLWLTHHKSTLWVRAFFVPIEHSMTFSELPHECLSCK
jgi:hypothetical protein